MTPNTLPFLLPVLRPFDPDPVLGPAQRLDSPYLTPAKIEGTPWKLPDSAALRERVSPRNRVEPWTGLLDRERTQFKERPSAEPLVISNTKGSGEEQPSSSNQLDPAPLNPQ